jgi:hypothetical protein
MPFRHIAVDTDREFSAESLRSILQRYLAIDAVLPTFSSENSGTTAQCILAIRPGDEKKYDASWRDRIFCRLLARVPNDRNSKQELPRGIMSSGKVN